MNNPFPETTRNVTDIVKYVQERGNFSGEDRGHTLRVANRLGFFVVEVRGVETTAQFYLDAGETKQGEFVWTEEVKVRQPEDKKQAEAGINVAYRRRASIHEEVEIAEASMGTRGAKLTKNNITRVLFEGEAGVTDLRAFAKVGKLVGQAVDCVWSEEEGLVKGSETDLSTVLTAINELLPDLPSSRVSK
ncbi:MAG: hypothetical protein WCT01_02380 [Candidatus Shapirobacteria bacterium]